MLTIAAIVSITKVSRIITVLMLDYKLHRWDRKINVSSFDRGIFSSIDLLDRSIMLKIQL
jgi:hypothetical protein